MRRRVWPSRSRRSSRSCARPTCTNRPAFRRRSTGRRRSSRSTGRRSRPRWSTRPLALLLKNQEDIQVVRGERAHACCHGRWNAPTKGHSAGAIASEPAAIWPGPADARTRGPSRAAARRRSRRRMDWRGNGEDVRATFRALLVHSTTISRGSTRSSTPSSARTPSPHPRRHWSARRAPRVEARP